MRTYVWTSLGLHLLLTVVGGLISVALSQPAPPANLIRVDLVTTPEVDRRETPPPDTPPETPPEEPVVVPPEPKPVQEVRPEVTPDEGADEPEPRELEIAPPNPDLPPAPEPVATPNEDLEFMEPAEVAATAPPVAEASETVPESADAQAIQVESQDGIPDYYLALIQRKIDRRWEPSAAETRGGRQVACIVRFRVSNGGQILEPRVVESSGLSVFDREALRAVISASPLPPPPARSLAAEKPIRVRFNLDR